MILNDLDLGGRPVKLKPAGGQTLGDVFVEGNRQFAFPRGGDVPKVDADFWIEAWQALGGQSAKSLAALRYLRQQLYELVLNRELQPLYIRWAQTAAANPMYPARDDALDGWWTVDAYDPDFESYNGAGAISARLTASLVAPAVPSTLQVRYDPPSSSSAMLSDFTAAPIPVIGFPVGSTQLPPTSSSRTGGEGIIPTSQPPSGGTVNPLPFVRPATIAGLFTGGVRAFDTVTTGANPVPSTGAFTHANWVEVKGWPHFLTGDLVVTNGLLLLLFQQGVVGLCSVYEWNTPWATPGWNLIGTVRYQDMAGNDGTLREINLDRLGLEEARIRVTSSTSAGNWCMFVIKLPRAKYAAYVEVWPKTENVTSQLTLSWSLASAYATGFTDLSSSTTFPSNLAPTTVFGYGAAQGSAVGSPIFGFFYQAAPLTAQGRLVSTTRFGFGDTNGITRNNYKLFGFFAVPFAGTPSVAAAQAVVNPLFQEWLYDLRTRWWRG